MDGVEKTWVLVLVLNFLMSCCIWVASAAQQQVPCFFIFGDSLVDNGNNNRMMVSMAKANYPPYGIDFPRGATGRFCNGRTSPDILAELLGFDDYIPPYSNAIGRDVLKGVNYASAAAGIRDETGMQLGGRTSFNGQLRKFQRTVGQVAKLLGDHNTSTNYLSKCIYYVGLGSNDYINNYFAPMFYSTSRQYDPVQYANALAQQFSKQIRTLYDYGARKVALIGLGQIGCSPYILARDSSDGRKCVERVNNANNLFNDRVRSLVDEFNNNLPEAKFIYVNTYKIFGEVLRNPVSFGFTVLHEGCCGVGRNNGQLTCLPNQTPCPNRDQHLFWDAFHPTEAASAILARRSYEAQDPLDTYPMDISHLAQL